jgi:hypothetical protein
VPGYSGRDTPIDSRNGVIGYGGCTGYCTGNHLHFEVIDNGIRENPLDYLPYLRGRIDITRMPGLREPGLAPVSPDSRGG